MDKTHAQLYGRSTTAARARPLRTAHREMETVKMQSDEDSDDVLYKKDRCRNRLDSVTPKEGPSDRYHTGDVAGLRQHSATTATSSATIRTTALTLRQFISIISDADGGRTSSEADS